MEKKEIKNIIEELNLPVDQFDIEDLYFQLNQLKQKIRIVEELPNLMDYSPQFILKQSCDKYDK